MSNFYSLVTANTKYSFLPTSR